MNKVGTVQQPLLTPVFGLETNNLDKQSINKQYKTTPALRLHPDKHGTESNFKLLGRITYILSILKHKNNPTDTHALIDRVGQEEDGYFGYRPATCCCCYNLLMNEQDAGKPATKTRFIG